jgi:hypothetical protein
MRTKETIGIGVLLSVAAVAGPASATTYWRSARNVPRDAVRPREHQVLSDIKFTHLRWSRWGPTEAVAHGSYWWNCQIITGPTPGGGFSCRPLVEPMTLTLSGARRCPDGRRTFARAVFSARGITRSDVLRYDCRGRSRREGTAA